MDALYNIYVFKLEKGEILFCPSLGDCSVLECEFMYPEICLNNRVSNIIDTHYNIEGWQIDGLVHAYMHKYGTNNVFGGSYYKPGLNLSTSDYIKFMANGLHELNERQQQCNKYKLITSETMDYESEITMYNELTALQSKYHINRDIINELEWLISVIIGNVANDFQRYQKLMKDLSNIYAQALMLFPELKTGLTYTRPDTFFDSRVLPFERNIWNYNYKNDTAVQQVIKDFELAIYLMVNREDEVLYDLEQINIEDIKNKCIMQKLLTRHK